MRKLFACLLAFGILLGLAPGAAQAAETLRPPGILLDDYPLAFPVPPTIVDGRTLVPFRAIAEALGITVTWHQETRSIDASGPGHEVRLVIDDRIMLVDGAPVALDVPPMIVSDRTLVPLRAFSTAFQAKVDWDPVGRNALVFSPPRAMRTLAFYALGSFAERDYVSHFSGAAYGWATLTADGQVDLASGEYKWPEPAGNISGEQLLADARQAGTKRYLMVHRTDKDDKLTALVKNDALRDQVAGNVAAAVSSKGFDGVVLDLEGLGLNETGTDLTMVQQGFIGLVARVAQTLHAVGKEVIVSVHPLNGAYRGYNYLALAAKVDALQIMAHDYLQDGKPEPMDRVDEAIRMALQAVGNDQRHKLLLGLLLGPDGASETAATIPQKVGLAKRYDLAGISVWRLGVVDAERMAALDATAIPRK
ncbi:MAG TPA: stalk domain-containing protein [Symbiobacteriaceae bacterium]